MEALSYRINTLVHCLFLYLKCHCTAFKRGMFQSVHVLEMGVPARWFESEKSTFLFGFLGIKSIYFNELFSAGQN
ncbi:hypothetical protein SAMN04487964_12242 [Marinobacterium sediminicola]|uniref:Uncharacterized protein n=1 Tax=Marinobacterium sediminicola TaxID=518898 RepID=A0ABY1S447_9GAMM|nr:hypothetical protein SAMN04487964_12242 [Marinobacterium sediminicola]